MLTWPLVVGLLALGSCTGFLAGLLGIGGGMTMVPFMVLLLVHQGYPAELLVKVAVATSLAALPEALNDISGPAVLLYGLAPRRAAAALTQLKEARS